MKFQNGIKSLALVLLGIWIPFLIASQANWNPEFPATLAYWWEFPTILTLIIVGLILIAYGIKKMET